MLCIFIPEVERAVAAGRAEGAVDRVERDVVHRVNVGNAALRLISVTLERKVQAGSAKVSRMKDLGERIRKASPRIFILHILDCATALDATNSEPVGVGKAADHSRLPLEGALNRFVKLGGFVQVDDVDISVRRANHQQLVPHVHCVHSLLALQAPGRVGGAEIPVLDHLVPGPRNCHGCAVGFEVANAADWLVVSGDLDRLAGIEIQDFGSLVCAAVENFGSILLETKRSALLLRANLSETGNPP